MSTTSAHTARAINELETAYIWSVNLAVEAGNPALIQELADSYQREAHDIVGGPGEDVPAAA